MPIWLIQLLQIIVPAVIKYGPEAVEGVKELFDMNTPTVEDWERLKQYAPPYEDYEIPQPIEGRQPLTVPLRWPAVSSGGDATPAPPPGDLPGS